MDFNEIKRLYMDGIEIKSISIDGTHVWTGYKNWVRYSTESDGVTIYNNGLGYKNGYRVRSGGTEQELTYGAITGFIPVKAGDVVRLSGWDFSYAQNGNAINVSDSSFTNIGQFTMLGADYGIFSHWEDTGAFNEYSYTSVIQEKEGIWKWIVPPTDSGVSYIRVSGYRTTAAPGVDMIVTINEEIYL